MKKTVELAEVPFATTLTVHVDEKLAKKLLPHATVTSAAVDAAIKTGAWTHDDPSTQLWLNSAFIPAKRERGELMADLKAHGIAVE